MIIYEFIQELIKRFEIEKNKEDLGGVYAITQRMIAYNSNRIEGSTLSEEQTASLFETGTINSNNEIIRAKDIEEMTGHFLMFNEMLETFNEDLSNDLIKKYHYKLKSGVFEDILNGYPIGNYKNRENIVGTIKTARPEKVVEEMELLINSYKSLTKVKLSDIVEFHAKFERIHPFQDGNGRVGRLLIFKECLKNNIMPLIINDKNKPQYYQALSFALNKNEYDSLIKLFENEQEKYYEYIKGFVIAFNIMK